MTPLVKKTMVVGVCLALAGGVATILHPRHEGIREAEALIIRRAPIARTAAVVTTTAVVASTTANANAAAQANAQAQANANAQAQALAQATANANAAAAQKPAIGSIVTALPPGCSQTKLNGVDYERCGATYYRASMMGSNLVFVVSQP